MSKEFDCPKCQSKMENGFVLDCAKRNLVSHWVAGPPQQDYWLGGVKAPAAALEITTYRCSDCGFLESYAW